MKLVEIKYTELKGTQDRLFYQMFDNQFDDYMKYINVNNHDDVAIVHSPENRSLLKLVKNIPYARSGVPISIYVMLVRCRLVGNIKAVMISAGNEDTDMKLIVNKKDLNKLIEKAANEDVSTILGDLFIKNSDEAILSGKPGYYYKNRRELTVEESKIFKDNKNTVFKKVSELIEDYVYKVVNVKTKITEMSLKGGSNAITFTSASIDLPIKLFRSLVISNFSTYTYALDDDTGNIIVSIDVHYDYEHFDGGTNGTSIGFITVEFDKEFNVVKDNFFPVSGLR